MFERLLLYIQSTTVHTYYLNYTFLTLYLRVLITFVHKEKISKQLLQIRLMYVYKFWITATKWRILLITVKVNVGQKSY